MVKEFNHIGVNVRDLQKTLAFYSEHLGAKFVRGLYIPASHTIAAYVQIGTQMIEFLSPLSPSESAVYGIAHIAYTVDHIEEAARILEEKGWHFHVPPKKAGSGGGKIAFLKDPNGANVELIERLESFSEPSWEPSTDVIEIDHASIYANDLQAGIDFYTKDMEMEMLQNYHFEDRKFDMVYMYTGKNILELLHNETPHEGPLMGHIAFRVKDTKALAEKLAAQGVEVTTQPRLLATQNGYVCNIKDPDGIALEFIDRVSLFEV